MAGFLVSPTASVREAYSFRHPDCIGRFNQVCTSALFLQFFGENKASCEDGIVQF
jgi:hypothetical protein